MAPAHQGFCDAFLNSIYAGPYTNAQAEETTADTFPVSRIRSGRWCKQHSHSPRLSQRAKIVAA